MSKSVTAPERLFAPPREVGSPTDCLFHQTTNVPGHGPVKGYWDLRGREHECPSGVELTGRRVLEVGPASGALSFFMEAKGADEYVLEVNPLKEHVRCYGGADGGLPLRVETSVGPRAERQGEEG